jgi:N-acetylglutamate synthase-like GNAT family acetyltransferase
MERLGAVTFAGPDDGAELYDILADTDMGLAGEPEEHVVLRQGGAILAGGRLYQADEDLFHLMVFAVAASDRGRGTGRRFLRKLAARPWLYCRDGVAPPDGTYRVTTMAKGAAAGFYAKAGFRPCDAVKLPAPFAGQCDGCPDREACRPLPMAYERSSREKPGGSGD